MNPLNRPEVVLWFQLGSLLAKAAEAGFIRAHKAFKPQRTQSYASRHPGTESPM